MVNDTFRTIPIDIISAIGSASPQGLVLFDHFKEDGVGLAAIVRGLKLDLVAGKVLRGNATCGGVLVAQHKGLIPARFKADVDRAPPGVLDQLAATPVEPV